MQALEAARRALAQADGQRRATQMQMSQMVSQHQDAPAEEEDEDLSGYQDELQEQEAKLREALRQARLCCTTLCAVMSRW